MLAGGQADRRTGGPSERGDKDKWPLIWLLAAGHTRASGASQPAEDLVHFYCRRRCLRIDLLLGGGGQSAAAYRVKIQLSASPSEEEQQQLARLGRGWRRRLARSELLNSADDGRSKAMLWPPSAGSFSPKVDSFCLRLYLLERLALRSSACLMSVRQLTSRVCVCSSACACVCLCVTQHTPRQQVLCPSVCVCEYVCVQV